MTIQQLAYFLAAIEHGSFSAAADALHLAQPSLSEQVRRLEDELGSALFVRGGRGLALTEAGAALRPAAERVLAEAELAREAVAEVTEMRSGTASLGTFGSAPYYLLGGVVSAFRSRHPGVRVRLVGQNSSEVADAVRDGDLEAGIIVLPVEDRGLDVRPVLRDEVVFASADPDRVRRPVTNAQLFSGPLILYDARFGTDDPTRRQLAVRAQRAGVSAEPDIEVEDIGVALQLAADGLGNTVVARWITVTRRFPRRLRLAPLREPLYDTFAIVTRRGARPSRATRELLDLAERQIASIGRRLEEPVA
jgi:DNA-binding transcriptional LysR family regulator